MSDMIEKYVYCIGCMGCVGKIGVVIMFLMNDDDEVMYDLRIEVEKSKMSKMNFELVWYEVVRMRVIREMKVGLFFVFDRVLVNDFFREREVMKKSDWKDFDNVLV